MKQGKFIYAVIIASLVAAYYVNSYISALPSYESAVVTRVIDGDTIVIEGGERVRLLDIDTPETGEKCFTEAKNRLAELIDGREVVLERRGENRDTYGRLLRYIIFNDTLVNLQLVREGFANLYIYDKNTPYYQHLIEAEQKAKEENLCVWQKH